MLRLNKNCFTLLVVLIITSCTEGNLLSEKRNPYELDYLAVKLLTEDDNWSIIDKNANVVVKEEYAPNDLISYVYDGVYWVKNNDKIQLYSIESPKKPICKDEYDMASDFMDGFSVVSKEGSPIQIVDTKGKIVTTLPDSIIFASPVLHIGLSLIGGVSGTEGVMDKQGNIILHGKKFVILGNDFLNYAECNDENTIFTTDLNGNIIGEFSNHKWGFLSIYNSEKKIAAYEYKIGTNEPGTGREPVEDAQVIIINEKGERLFNLNKSYALNSLGALYQDGYITYGTKEKLYGLADSNGENIIRPKFQQLLYLGDKKYLASKNSQYGVIDIEENIIVPFNYDGGVVCRLGKNFILSHNNALYIVDNNGKELNKNGYVAMSIPYGLQQINTGKMVEKNPTTTLPAEYVDEYIDDIELEYLSDDNHPAKQ